jgi:hypothetical protein
MAVLGSTRSYGVASGARRTIWSARRALALLALLSVAGWGAVAMLVYSLIG